MKHLESYINRLKSHGYKVTHQRLVVLDYLLNSLGHPSAEIIYNDLKEKYPTISLATIYNTLEMLTKVGLVLDLGAPEERRRFDGCLKEHCHFFCSNCGKIEDIEVPELPEVLARIRQTKYKHVDRYRLDFFGVCDECKPQLALDNGQLAVNSQLSTQ